MGGPGRHPGRGIKPVRSGFQRALPLNDALPGHDHSNVMNYHDVLEGRHMIGQRVHEEFISNQQEMLELEWPTPAQLTPGTYLLRVQAGEAVEQRMMVKQ